MIDRIPKKRKSRAKPKAEHKPNGRPRTALTNERKAIIVNLIGKGNFMTTAAAFAGLSVDTVNNALKEGRASCSGPNREFVVAVDKAHAEWVASLVAATTAAAHNHPDIALKMLAADRKSGATATLRSNLPPNSFPTCALSLPKPASVARRRSVAPPGKSALA